ncbi:hypothetical protein HFO33_29375 [Rhizobium leguminosarum]|nr:hypothetical protein [Rhizobium leguminosarum]
MQYLALGGLPWTSPRSSCHVSSSRSPSRSTSSSRTSPSAWPPGLPSSKPSPCDETSRQSSNPIFTWMRLAQRIPVAVHIDVVPPGVSWLPA